MKKLCATAVALVLACSVSSAFAASKRNAKPEAQPEAQYGQCYKGKYSSYTLNSANVKMADQECHADRSAASSNR